MDVLPQERRVDIVEQVEATVNAVVFPQGSLDPAAAPMGAQLADEGALRRLLARQGREDAPAKRRQSRFVFEYQEAA